MCVVCPRDGPRGNSAGLGGEAIQWGLDCFLLGYLGVPLPIVLSCGWGELFLCGN
jgi:hypothetical protein